MREAIGGSWLLGFVLFFIVLFSGYLALSINYTKAFKVKNKIINLIEENEGFTPTVSASELPTRTDDYLSHSDKTEDKVYLYLKDIGYASTTIPGKKCPSGDEIDMHEGGYCVEKICSAQGAYYKVTSFIKIELPLIPTLVVPITGETKVLFYTQDGKDTCKGGLI